jgi:hypothetical protein
MTFTNAMHNRNQAVRLLEAGFTVKQIAKQFPEVWRVEKGCLAQIYSSTLEDGRKETPYAIASHVVDELITQRAPGRQRSNKEAE